MDSLYQCGRCEEALVAEEEESLVKKLIKNTREHGVEMTEEEALRKIREED